MSLSQEGGAAPTLTKRRSVTVEREIELERTHRRKLGAQLGQGKVATKTNDVAGDGTRRRPCLSTARVHDGKRSVTGRRQTRFFSIGFSGA